MRGDQNKRKDVARDVGGRARRVARQVANHTKVRGPVAPNYRTQDKGNKGGKDNGS